LAQQTNQYLYFVGCAPFWIYILHNNICLMCFFVYYVYFVYYIYYVYWYYCILTRVIWKIYILKYWLVFYVLYVEVVNLNQILLKEQIRKNRYYRWYYRRSNGRL
jgi:hypothetical protein